MPSASRRPRALRLLLGLVAALGVLVLVAAGGFLVWANVGVMDAEKAPYAAVLEDPGIVVRSSREALVLLPGDATASSPEGNGAPTAPAMGLVFYPGAKVEAEAYAARLSALVTEHEVAVVIVRPALHLALFDRRGLSTFTDLVPEAGTWMVGGHSMGGVRACQVAAEADALILFGSYCATDLSGTDLPVLSLGGSEDGLSTPQKIADARPLLPADAELVEIPGASHASFGDYGPQAGDGTPTIDDGAMTAEVTQQISGLMTDLALT